MATRQRRRRPQARASAPETITARQTGCGTITVVPADQAGGGLGAGAGGGLLGGGAALVLLLVAAAAAVATGAV